MEIQKIMTLPATINVPGKLNKVGWKAPEDLSQLDWLKIGKAFRLCEGAVQWWLGDWWATGVKRKYGEGEALAEKAGVDYGAVRTYASVVNAYELSMRIDNLTFYHHQVAISAPPDERQKWLRLAVKKKWSANKLKAEIAHGHAKDRTDDVELDAKSVGKFALIYADPPWRYENPPMGGSNRSIEKHYPTMELGDICAMDISSVAHKDSLLFLWATAPKLAECMKVIEAWGFVYRTNAVWDKMIIGMGYHFRNQHELLLIGKRGELPPPRPKNRPASIYKEKRGKHSAKPDYYRDMMDNMYPALGKLELFARPDDKSGLMPERKSWTFWGNQIVNNVQIKEAAE